MSRQSYSTLNNQVSRAVNPRWSVVRHPSGQWMAAEPWHEDCSIHAPDRDKAFDTYSDALDYAIEQAEVDAIIKTQARKLETLIEDTKDALACARQR